MMTVIVLGNAGAGKSTLARRLIADRDVPCLSLDDIAWSDVAVRKPLAESLHELDEFIRFNSEWVLEGCYGDLVEAALPHCSELRFLNPGVEVCVAHCLSRPWEPDKFSSPEEQEAMLNMLVQWVREYETRDDEFGLKRHRKIFDGFAGFKREHLTVESYAEG